MKPHVFKCTLKYGWYTSGLGLAIIENGVDIGTYGSYGSYAPGGVLRIAREDGQIKYYYNGTLKRTVADAQPTTPMIIDYALHQYNRSIYDLNIYNTMGSADIASFSDYYPFGQQMAQRFGSDGGEKYRYGFNGKEEDKEIAGDGSLIDYGFRFYDSRIASVPTPYYLDKKAGLV